jgi:hypothetical protein
VSLLVKKHEHYCVDQFSTHAASYNKNFALWSRNYLRNYCQFITYLTLHRSYTWRAFNNISTCDSCNFCVAFCDKGRRLMNAKFATLTQNVSRKPPLERVTKYSATKLEGDVPPCRLPHTARNFSDNIRLQELMNCCKNYILIDYMTGHILRLSN